jgi:hypothetical protein
MSTITTAPDSSPRRNSHWSVSIAGGLGFLLFSVVAVLFHDSIRSMPLFGESVVISVLNTILLALMSLLGALVTLTVPLIIATDVIASLVLLWNTRKYPQLAKTLRQHELEHGPHSRRAMG